MSIMKKLHIYCLLLLAIAVSMVSCSKDNYWNTDVEDKEGQLSLSSLIVEVNGNEETVSRASYDVSSFIVKIYGKADNSLVKQYTYSEMPEIVSLAVGDYSVKVISHEQESAAWDKPYFEGSADFSITDSRITEIGTITCKLANVKVSIRYSDELKKLMGDDVKVTVEMNDGGQLVFTPTETRSGYFKYVEGSSTLVASFNGTVDGDMVTLRKEYADVQPGQHRIITFKLKNEEDPVPDKNGGITVGGIQVDASVTTIDLNTNVTIEEDVIEGDRPGGGGDKPDPEPDPEPSTAITITAAELSFDGTNDPASGASGVINIHSDKGIKNLNVEIGSTSNEFVAAVSDLLPMSFDLANPGDYAASFESLGFPTGSAVTGQTDVVFDITQFVPMLGIYSGTHTFKIEVVDAEGGTLAKTLTFIAQ